MALMDELVGAMRMERASTLAIAPGVDLPVYTFAVSRWAGERLDSLSDDCRKRAALLTASDGTLTCIEVEVVRQIRAAGVDAGWVQGFPCGRARWASAVWPALTGRAGEVNGRVQEQLGKRRTSLAGHPDVLATDGDRIAYLECKVWDALKPSQVQWLTTALGAGLLDAADVAIAHGVLA